MLPANRYPPDLRNAVYAGRYVPVSTINVTHCISTPATDSYGSRFILNYIDRNALPQARRQGLEEDLGLVGSQYNTVLSLTFAGYILGQVPSNMIMGSISRPSIYLSGMMVSWGLASAASGAAQRYGDIAVCRLLLGLCE